MLDLKYIWLNILKFAVILFVLETSCCFLELKLKFSCTFQYLLLKLWLIFQTSTTNTVSTSGTNKTWSSVTSSQEDGGPERNFLGQQSPFFPQEFPKLAGGDAPTEGNQKSSVDSQYGPGPSLRPQSKFIFYYKKFCGMHMKLK